MTTSSIDTMTSLSTFAILDRLGVKSVSSNEKIINYTKNDKGVYKKDGDTFFITGSDKQGTYGIIDKTDKDSKYRLIYCGKISGCIGIDIDDYSEKSTKQKLLDHGYTENFINNYPYITTTGKNGVHILHKHTLDTDIQTTNLEIQGKKSVVDVRGTSLPKKDKPDKWGIMIAAGSKSNIGDYHWYNENADFTLPLMTLEDSQNNLLLKSVRTCRANKVNPLTKHTHKKNDKTYNKIAKELKKIEKDYLKTNNLGQYTIKPKKEEDIKIFTKILENLKDKADDYTDWCVIGMILANEFKYGIKQGLELFKHFSKQVPEKYSDFACEKIWDDWTGKDICLEYAGLNKTTLLKYLIEETDNINALSDIRNEVAEEKVIEENKDKAEEDKEEVIVDEFSNAEYRAMKLIFENGTDICPVRHYKVGMGYVMETFYLGGEMVTEDYKKGEIIDRYDDYGYVIVTKQDGKKQRQRFIDMWLRDPNKLGYFNSCFRPSQGREIEEKGKMFVNHFLGFGGAKMSIDDLIDIKDIENIKKNTISIFLERMKMLCEENDYYTKYLLAFIRKIFVFPEEKECNVMVCLISTKMGLGKTSFLDFIQKMIGEEYCFETAKIEDIVGTHSEATYNKLLLCFNEATLKDTISAFDRFKSMITDKKDTCNIKHQRIKKIENHTHNFFVANKILSVKIEPEDRRHYVLYSKSPGKEKLKKHHDKWDKYIRKNEYAKYIIYDYLVNYTKYHKEYANDPMFKADYNWGGNIPQTLAKSKIQDTFVDLEVQFLKFVLESNFRDLSKNITGIHAQLLANFYNLFPEDYVNICHGGSRSVAEIDSRCSNVEGKNYKVRDMTENDRYREAIRILKKMLDLKRIFEYGDNDKLIIPTGNHSMTDKQIDNIKDKDLESVFYQFQKKLGWKKWNGRTEENIPWVVCDRSEENQYIKWELGSFLFSLKKWRTECGYTNECKKNKTQIENKFSELFIINTSPRELMKIVNVGGYKWITFNKKELLEEIEDQLHKK